MVPLGITIQNFAPESFWSMTGASAAQYADLNIMQFITANLIPVTLGNIVGGAVLVGLANWCIYRRPQLKATNISTITTTANIASVKENTMNSNIIVKNIMNAQPVTLSADMTTPKAIDHLISHHEVSAPVTDVQGRLVGFFSVHDVMVDLWCQDYIPTQGQKVVDLMSRDVVAIDVNDKLVDVAEYLCIDKEQLYPTTSMGIATRFSMLSLEERAKSIKVNKPHTLPVLENGQMVGVINRLDVLDALRSVYGKPVEVLETHQQSA